MSKIFFLIFFSFVITFQIIIKILKKSKKFFDKTQNNDMFISLTAVADYNERFRDMYTFSELILNIRKLGKIDSRKMQGQSAFSNDFFSLNRVSLI